MRSVDVLDGCKYWRDKRELLFDLGLGANRDPLREIGWAYASSKFIGARTSQLEELRCVYFGRRCFYSEMVIP